MSVLQTLCVDPDPTAKKRAGEWLEEFQHSVHPFLAYMATADN
jgi:hypothetical protein